MNKDQVAVVLNEIAVLLELKGENPFKSRAYVNAARTLETLPEPLAQIIEEAGWGTSRGSARRSRKKFTSSPPPGGWNITRP